MNNLANQITDAVFNELQSKGMLQGSSSVSMSLIQSTIKNKVTDCLENAQGAGTFSTSNAGSGLATAGHSGRE